MSNAVWSHLKNSQLQQGLLGGVNHTIHTCVNLDGDFRKHALQISHYTEEGTEVQLDILVFLISNSSTVLETGLFQNLLSPSPVARFPGVENAIPPGGYSEILKTVPPASSPWPLLCGVYPYLGNGTSLSAES